MDKSVFEKYMEKYNYRPGGDDAPKQIEAIIRVWDLLNAGDSLAAARAITEYEKRGDIDITEPIMATLSLRVGNHLVDHRKSNDDFVLGVARMMAKQGSQDLIFALMLLQKQLQGNTDPDAKQIYLNLSVMMRYGLFFLHKLLTPEKREEFFAPGENYRKLWDLYRPDEPFDHAGVEPFILDLCPPAEMK